MDLKGKRPSANVEDQRGKGPMRYIGKKVVNKQTGQQIELQPTVEDRYVSPQTRQAKDWNRRWNAEQLDKRITASPMAEKARKSMQRMASSPAAFATPKPTPVAKPVVRKPQAKPRKKS